MSKEDEGQFQFVVESSIIDSIMDSGLWMLDWFMKMHPSSIIS